MIDRARISMLFTLATLAALPLAACGADAGAPGGDENVAEGDSEEVGSLELLLSSVPADAACLQVSLTGTRNVPRSFPLRGGSSPKLLVDRLPVGLVKVEASGFAEKCPKVKPSSVPNGVLDKPVTAKIDALSVAKILLKLVRNG